MSDIFVRHNEPWIGIPAEFPFEGRWATSGEWADELVAYFVEPFGEPGPGEKESMRDFLVSVADSRESRLANRIFIAPEGWTGRFHMADMAVISADTLPGMGVEDVAGANDETAVEKPYVEPFVSDMGVAGVMCQRYHQRNGGIQARVDYVFPVPGGFLRIYTATRDLVAYERVLPLLADLARTASVE